MSIRAGRAAPWRYPRHVGPVRRCRAKYTVCSWHSGWKPLLTSDGVAAGDASLASASGPGCASPLVQSFTASLTTFRP